MTPQSGKPLKFVAMLETLRGVAAWMVVLHHLRPALGAVWAPLGSTPVFASGVDLFFILSGVVMVILSERKPSPGHFLAARAARVLPLYWLVTAAIVAMLIAGLRPLGIADWAMGDVCASGLLWPAFRTDGQPGPLLAIGWTLMFEAMFYLIFAVALLMRGRLSAAVPAASGIIILLAIGFFASPKSLPLATWTAPIMAEFLVGLMLGAWWCRFGRRMAVPRLAPALCALLSVAGLVGAAVLLGAQAEGALIPPLGSASAHRVLAFGVPMTGLVLAALLAEAAGLRPGVVMRTSGAASYSIYLFHMLVIQAVGKATGQGAALLLSLPIIALMSVLVHYWVERPLTRAARRLLLGRKKPAQPATVRLGA